jgi:glycosyltransferase involved in cell wall biosynthesis
VVCWSNGLDHDDGRYPFALHRIPRRDRRFLRFFKTVTTLWKCGADADVFFSNSLDLEIHAAARRLGKPVVHKVVGDRAWEAARSRGWFRGTIDAYQKAPKSLALRALDRWRSHPLLRATRVIVPSRYLARLVVSWGVPEARIRIVPNATPVDCRCGSVHLPAFSGKTIATVCRLVPWKGVDRLIAAMVELPYARLAIAGDGRERETLQSLARRKGVSDRVVFLGQLDAADVRALLAISDVFVLNSSYEGMPHVVLEAMAAGVPVVATDAGGTGEVITNERTGLLIPNGDDEALLAAIRRLLHSDELARSLAGAARTAIGRDFSEQACFSAYEAILAEAAGAAEKRAVAG